MNRRFRKHLLLIAACMTLLPLPTAAAAHRGAGLGPVIARIEKLDARLADIHGRRIREARRHLREAERLLREARDRRTGGSRVSVDPLVFSFIKSGSGRQKLRADISHLTRHRAYDRLVVVVGARGGGGVLLRAVGIDAGGHHRRYPLRRRLSAGRNVLYIPVPAGAERITLSVERGAGSRVTVAMR